MFLTLSQIRDRAEEQTGQRLSRDCVRHILLANVKPARVYPGLKFYRPAALAVVTDTIQRRHKKRQATVAEA